MASGKPSYRCNRDYSKSFKWTYDLDKDLYECYTKSKSDPRIGYMNQMKEFWDEKHPESSSLTRIFQTNLKKVFLSFKESLVTLKTMLSQENVETFWKGIWELRSQVNYENTVWMKQLKKEYSNNVRTKTYQITEDILQTAVNKIQPNKEPGRDLIAGFWYKNFDFYKPTLTYLFEKTFKVEGKLPIWLTTASTPKKQ